MRAFEPRISQPTTSAKAAMQDGTHLRRMDAAASPFPLRRAGVSPPAPQLSAFSSEDVRGDNAKDPVGAPAYPDFIQRISNAHSAEDVYEREADLVADHVLRMPEPQRQQQDQELAPLRTQPAGLVRSPAPSIVNDVLASPGEPLDPATRTFMESRFGYDFSKVQIHSDAAAEHSAASMNARAYTVGHNIVFGGGQLAAGTTSGRQLIAHELAHVVQQTAGNGTTSLPLQRQPAPTPARQGKILSLKEINADPEREKARQKTGQTEAKVCRSISAGASKDNCPATLEPGLQVVIVAEKAGGAWLQIITPEKVSGFGPKEPLYVMAAFVQTLASGTAPTPGPATGGQVLKDVLRLDQTVPIKGLASNQPNYVDISIRAISSAPIGPDFTLIPLTDATGQNGIAIPKGDFHVDKDPLAGFAVGHNQVYKTRAVADGVLADLAKLSPDTPMYAYYLRDGLIFPTTLSETTLPVLMPYLREKREQDLRDIKATADLAEDVMWWYVGARFPIKIKPGGAAPKVGRLILAKGRVLSAPEMAIAEKLVAEGRTVKALAESVKQGVRTADFVVDGVRTELKTISSLTSKDISGALGRRILEGAGQAPHIIADVQQQAGMTQELARQAVRRAFGADKASRIQQIRVIGQGFDFTVPRMKF